MSPLYIVGARISSYLNANCIKQRWLAEQLGISESKLSNTLNSKVSLDADLLFKICEVLNISYGNEQIKVETWAPYL